MRNLFIIFIICSSTLSCINQRSLCKNDDIAVEIQKKNGSLHLIFENIGSTAIVLGINASIVRNENSTEIQIGEYSYLQLFMTDFKIITKDQSHEFIIENIYSEKYTVKLVYTKVKDPILEENIFESSTTLLFPNGKFLILKVENSKINAITESIY